jgi:hypothetical protein
MLDGLPPPESDAYERFVQTLLGWASFMRVGPRAAVPPGALRAPVPKRSRNARLKPDGLRGLPLHRAQTRS